MEGAGADGGAVEELVENTTVIAVNVTDDSMLRPGDAVTRCRGYPGSWPDSSRRSNSNRSANDTQAVLKGKKLGHRRIKDGVVSWKKFETTPLMRSIQLGIHQSVGNLASQEDRDILHEDFYTVETVVFSRWPPVLPPP
jgi:hypothetical protein